MGSGRYPFVRTIFRKRCNMSSSATEEQHASGLLTHSTEEEKYVRKNRYYLDRSHQRRFERLGDDRRCRTIDKGGGAGRHRRSQGKMLRRRAEGRERLRRRARDDMP